jgi:Uncharacterized protein conserved in bacteria (DUF2330)
MPVARPDTMARESSRSTTESARLGTSRAPWRDVAVRVGRVSALLLVMLGASAPTPADACGGAFFPPSVSETVAVRGHQMAIAISKKQTVVWDRIDVEGNPSELAWVIPVRDGARLELSNEAWFTALSGQTAATVRSAGGGGGGGGGGGCGCAGASDESAVGSAGSSGSTGGVSVLERSDVGPYDAARLRAKDPGSIRTWLLDNGFKIPDDIGPVLDQYTSEGFDFIALRVRPGAATAGLQPLRLTTPGADPTLPLRMSRAGVKSQAALTLFVVAEGRYRVQGFEEVPVDRSRITIGSSSAKSTYDDVVESQLAAGDGLRFVVEHAKNDPEGLAAKVFAAGSCIPSPNPPSLGGGTTSTDAGVDAASPDAGDDAGGDPDDAGEGGVADAGIDAAPAPPPNPEPPIDVTTCATTDLAIAREGMSDALWITRLRANLPSSAFAKDLTFEANPAQDPVSSDYVVSYSGGAMIAPARPSPVGSVALFGATVAGLIVMLGRRRRAR